MKILSNIESAIQIAFLSCAFGMHLFWGGVFFRAHPRHVEVLRLGVESELQLLAYTTATAMPDPNRVCDLHHSSWQCRILSPLSEASNLTHSLMVPSWIHFCCAMTELLTLL